jgi:glycosyltransferase involved in cell wall biosynthesis
VKALEDPELSIIVVVYNMRREAPRTLQSLSPSYQSDVESESYEVVVVENGSSKPLNEEIVESFGERFRYLFLEEASPSPAAAVNYGSRQSRSKHIGIMIDGARMVSPGMVGLALRCLRAFERPVIGTLGFHLGPDLQIHAGKSGYDEPAEDRLLADIGWPADGYRLFEIATLALSSRRGWFGSLFESNCAFMPRAIFEELNGFDEAFDAPGGGLVNLDFWRRACELEDSTVINLLGEGSFHQIHGGAATSRTEEELNRMYAEWGAQYERIRGEVFSGPERTPLVVGYPRPAAFAAAASGAGSE